MFWLGKRRQMREQQADDQSNIRTELLTWWKKRFVDTAFVEQVGTLATCIRMRPSPTSASISTILIEMFRGSPQPFQTNVEIVPWIRNNRFLPHPFRFFIRYHPVIWRCIFYCKLREMQILCNVTHIPCCCLPHTSFICSYCTKPDLCSGMLQLSIVTIVRELQCYKDTSRLSYVGK
jgi:hypothetical protein